METAKQTIDRLAQEALEAILEAEDKAAEEAAYYKGFDG